MLMVDTMFWALLQANVLKPSCMWVYIIWKEMQCSLVKVPLQFACYSAIYMFIPIRAYSLNNRRNKIKLNFLENPEGKNIQYKFVCCCGVPVCICTEIKLFENLAYTLSSEPVHHEKKTMKWPRGLWKWICSQGIVNSETAGSWS